LSVLKFRPRFLNVEKGQVGVFNRAVDSGATIDFLLSAKRDAAAAERFLANPSNLGLAFTSLGARSWGPGLVKLILLRQRAMPACFAWANS
jgi:hypothetical protein